MPKTVQCDFVMIVDAQGDFAVGRTFDAAKEAYEADIGSLGDSNGFRSIGLGLTVPVPDEIAVTGAVPVTDGEVALSVV